VLRRVIKDLVTICSSGQFYDPRTGGDTFTTMSWTAIPETLSEFSDYRESLWMVADLCSFSDGVMSIDFTSAGGSVEITDDGNSLLEEDRGSEEDEVEDDNAEAVDEGAAEDGNEDQSELFSIRPVDSVEKRLAAIIDRDEVDVNEPAYTYNIQDCGSCGCSLEGRGVYVNRGLRELMLGNMCAAGFGERGESLGAGKTDNFTPARLTATAAWSPCGGQLTPWIAHWCWLPLYLRMELSC
jgi:hypothetical protein